MADAQRIRLSRAKGWRKPEGAITVARPGPWGNPFVVGTYGTAAECVAQFAVLARGYIDIGTSRAPVEDQIATAKRIRDHICELSGHDLACWCRLDKPCHADVLLDLASGRDPSRDWMFDAAAVPRILIGLDEYEATLKGDK